MSDFYHYTIWKILDISDHYYEIRSAIECGKAINIAENGNEKRKKFVPHDPISALDAVLDYDAGCKATGIKSVKSISQAKRVANYLNGNKKRGAD